MSTYSSSQCLTSACQFKMRKYPNLHTSPYDLYLYMCLRNFTCNPHPIKCFLFHEIMLFEEGSSAIKEMFTFTVKFNQTSANMYPDVWSEEIMHITCGIVATFWAYFHRRTKKMDTVCQNNTQRFSSYMLKRSSTPNLHYCRMFSCLTDQLSAQTFAKFA